MPQHIPVLFQKMNSKEFSRFLHKRISIARIVKPAFYPRLYSAPYAVMFAQEKSESPKLLYGAVERIYNLPPFAH